MQTKNSHAPIIHITFIAAVLLICGSTFAVNYAQFSFASESFLWTIRTVIKMAFTFYAFSYIASPLHSWKPSRVSAFLMKYRATTGVCFALSQLAAGACVAVIWFNWPQIIIDISTPFERVLGVIVFVWIFVMLITSNAFSIEKMGYGLWSKIHSYGMAAIWIAYLLDYGMRTLKWSPYYGVFIAILLLIWSLRLRILVLKLF